jgi:NitT/TauT family transport system permease protein
MSVSGIFRRVELISLKDAAKLAAPLLVILICLAIDTALPDVYPEGYRASYFPIFLRVALVIYLIGAALSVWFGKVRRWVLHFWGLLILVFGLLGFLDFSTIKTGNMQLPYVPSPDAVLAAVFAPDQMPKVLFNLGASLSLYFQGVALGFVAGMIYGSLMGYSRFASYWLSPFLKLIGPVPGTAWMALAMVLAPSSHMASVCLVALTVWFPLSVNLSGGIRGVSRTWIERAETMGASNFYILKHVIYPAVLPNIFTGLFMGFCFSLTSLAGAEMLGVKGGLGWQISVAEGFSLFDVIYSTTIIFILVAFTLLTILFKVQKHAMKWSKGAVQW